MKRVDILRVAKNFQVSWGTGGTMQKFDLNILHESWQGKCQAVLHLHFWFSHLFYGGTFSGTWVCTYLIFDLFIYGMMLSVYPFLSNNVMCTQSSFFTQERILCTITCFLFCRCILSWWHNIVVCGSETKYSLLDLQELSATSFTEEYFILWTQLHLGSFLVDLVGSHFMRRNCKVIVNVLDFKGHQT